MIHYHYIVQGFELDEKDGGLADVATIDVLANSEDEALSIAATLVSKNHYRVSSVIAHDPDAEQASMKMIVANGHN